MPRCPVGYTKSSSGKCQRRKCPGRCRNGSKCDKRLGRCVSSSKKAKRKSTKAKKKKKRKKSTAVRRKRCPNGSRKDPKNPDECISKSDKKRKSTGKKRKPAPEKKRKSTGKKKRVSGRKRKPAPEKETKSTVTWKRSGLTYTLPKDQMRGYKLDKLLGEGMSGSVYLDGNKAIKIYPLNRLIPCWSCKLGSGKKRKDAVKHTSCSKAPDYGGDCRCEGTADFRHELKATKRMSGSGIAPKFIDGWVAKGGRSSINQPVFDVGVLVTEAWPMSFAQYRKKYQMKLKGENKKLVEAHFKRLVAKLNKMRLFAHDLQFENLVVKVSSCKGHFIEDMALIDFSDMEAPGRGDCNQSEFNEIMSMCAH